MKQGGPLKRKTGLKSTGFKPKVPVLAPSPEPDEHRPHPELRQAKPRKQLRAGRVKMTAIRRSAQGEECEIRIPGVCNRNPETTVLCHSNELKDGKGMGLKAPDTAAAYGCSSCHDVLDGRAPLPSWLSRAALLAMFAVGILMTHVKLRKKGLMK